MGKTSSLCGLIRNLVIAASSVALAAITPCTFAQSGTRTWIGGGGAWDVGAGWLPVGVPTGSDEVIIAGSPQLAGGGSGSSFRAHLGTGVGQGALVTVIGAPSQWSNVNVITAGDAAGSNGRIEVSFGGKVLSGGLVLGSAQDSTGSIQVKDPGSKYSGALTIGDLGAGGMVVEGEGEVASAGIGYLSIRGGAGTATVRGQGSKWDHAGELYVGYDGSGIASVEQQATVTTVGLTIGGGVAFTSDGRKGTGTVEVAGPGTTWTNTGFTTIGSTHGLNQATSGLLRITDGGSFASTRAVYLGLGPEGEMIVSGNNSRFSAGDAAVDSVVGQTGEGQISVFAGSTVTFTSRRLRLGVETTARGAMEVNGIGALLTSTGEIELGVQGAATVTVDNGGRIVAPLITLRSRNLGGGVFAGNILNLNGTGAPGQRGVLETQQINDAGTFNFDGGILRTTAGSTNLFAPSALAPLNVLARGAFIDTNGFTVTIARPFSGEGAFTKLGAGTLNLTFGASTYGGGTTISAGTLALGASNVLPATAVSIGSATLNAANFTDTVGTLDVTGSAVLNLGASAALAFASSSGIDWTDGIGGTFTITGTFVSGSSVRFGTDSSGLTAAQLALISKPGGGAVALNSSGYLIDAPINNYAFWASTNAPGGTLSEDHDSDGVINGVEYVLGGDALTDDISKLPAISTSGGNILFTFKRAQASINATTALSIKVGTTLLTWPDTYNVGADTAASSAGVSIQKSVPAGFDTITLSIPQSPDLQKFIRLNVTITQ